jgi:hypothetical protein
MVGSPRRWWDNAGVTDTLPYRPGYDSTGHEFDANRITPPTDRPPYLHAEGCRGAGSDPPWEMHDLATRTWRRGPCGQHPACTVVQYHDPQAAVARPPRPADDDPALVAFLAEHGSRHVEVELVVAPGDVLPHWQARCTNPACRQVHRWRHEAAEHYRAAGLRLWGASSTPIGPMTLAELTGVH